MHRLDRFYCVITVAARWFKAEFTSELVEKSICGSFPDSHRAIALHVAVPSDGTKPGAGFANLPAAQHHIHYLLNVSDCVLMLRQSHRPTKDCAFRFNKDLRSRFDLLSRNTRLLNDFMPRCVDHRHRKFFKPTRVTANEVVIQYLARAPLFFCKDRFANSLEQRHVAIDPHLEKKIRQRGPLTNPTQNILWVLEARHAQFGKRIDVHQPAAIPFGLLQRC